MSTINYRMCVPYVDKVYISHWCVKGQFQGHSDLYIRAAVSLVYFELKGINSVNYIWRILNFFLLKQCVGNLVGRLKQQFQFNLGNGGGGGGGGGQLSVLSL